jgi:hypothetical protein
MKSVILPNSSSVDTSVQLFLDNLDSLQMSAAGTSVYIGMSGTSNFLTVTTNDDTDAKALIQQINNAILSSASITYVYGSPSVPSAPVGVSATADIGAIKLAWTASAASICTYNIYRSTATNTETLYASGITTNSFIDSSTGTTTYYYKISTVVPRGESSLSSEVTTVGTAPATPVITTYAADYNAVNLGWGAVAGSTLFPDVTYNIYLNGSGSPTYTGISGITYTVPSLTSITAFKVSAVINSVEGAKSDSQSQTPLTLSAPSVTKSAGYYNVTLSSYSVAGAQFYNIYRDSTLIQTNWSTSESTYVDSSLSYETAYSYQISASANGIEGPLSSATASVNPSQVSGLSASPSSLSASAGGDVVFSATTFDANQNGKIAYGIGSVSYLPMTYNLDGTGTVTFPAGLTTGTIAAYYVVNNDLNTSTTVNTNITFT